MWLKGITDEDFVNYKVPSMFIATSTCTFKCDKECGRQICQNMELAKEDDIHTGDDYLINRKLRMQYGCTDPVVIYTGYTEEEANGWVQFLMSMPNIIVKFGRYIPDQQPHRDPILGVDLASDNQYAKQIS